MFLRIDRLQVEMPLPKEPTSGTATPLPRVTAAGDPTDG
jgi:hypothetical protein